MAWMIRHRCNVTDSEDRDYAIFKGERNGEKVTKVECPNCREQFYMVGHGMFEDAQPSSAAEPGTYPGLPAGFVFPGLYE